MLNQESFLKQRIQKGQEQLKKQRNENRKKELTYLMFECLNAAPIIDNVGMNDLNDLSWMIGQNLKQIERRLDETQAEEVVENRAENVIGREQGMENNVDAMQSQHWSLDFTNNNFGDVLPFENGNNVPHGLWPY
ncbi:agamous-like MADS-box protein AGL80-like [Trifolium medium]|uniref:Agamous-like MADS-box protein AGL80-like n=1 Tax=Trifolium medium TaxID=97028 RepID=A0A392N5A4_9FABA|nr:agamous-like MADS-box protein AGL80-like [Trifolium medium]